MAFSTHSMPKTRENDLERKKRKKKKRKKKKKKTKKMEKTLLGILDGLFHSFDAEDARE